MEKGKSWIIESIIIAVAVAFLGYSIKSGIDNFTNKDRKVTVKGLATKEVPADKVTWPIVSKEIGNDLPQLYNKINLTNATIITFLKKNGLTNEEININAPVVIDLNAERYNTNRSSDRYNITSVITVTSSKVDKVREIISRQGELLRDGIAIVEGGYENPITYEYTDFNSTKAEMMAEAITNAEATAQQFAECSKSKLDKIINADQGQFNITDRDTNTPYIKNIRVVTTITYSLKN